MSYCRFCGRELVNGACSCQEFQASIGNVAPGEGSNQGAAWKPSEPIFVPKFKLRFATPRKLISSLRSQSDMTEEDRRSKDPFEHNVPIVPDCVPAEENEIVVKQYNIAKLRSRMKFMKAEGRLMVTNRRVLFRAAGTSLTGNVLQEHEFGLDEIGGVEVQKDYKFSLMSFLGCALLDVLIFFLSKIMFLKTNNAGMIAFFVIIGILCLLPTFVVYRRFWLKLILAIVGAASFSAALSISRKSTVLTILLFIAFAIELIDLFVVSYVPNLVIKVKAKGAAGAIVIGSQKGLLKRQDGTDYSGFKEVMPWEDTVMAMNELGAMIDDLQKHGDYAIEKWSVQ